MIIQKEYNNDLKGSAYRKLVTQKHVEHYNIMLEYVG